MPPRLQKEELMEKGLISVDRWTENSQVYFLTHLHADHTQGLSSSWSRGPLFCSRLTAKLFPFKFPDFNLSLLRVITTGTWHSVSLISPSTGSETVLQIMAIDAHHCPGAVMFLIRGYFGCVLYTGDFRWETTSERAEKGRINLLNALKDDVVDILYLDNTYCNPSYAFPSREVAAQQVVDIIASHPEHDIVIGIDTLGKEDLLLHISHVLEIKIWLWPERLQTMHLLGFCDTFTTKTTLTRVRAIPRYSFSIDTLEGLNLIRPTIGIMPSGLPWVLRPSEKQPENLGSAERFHKDIYYVSYSDHACFAEIQEFVKLVRPTNVRSIVCQSSCYNDPLYFFGHFCGANQSGLHKKKREGKIERDVPDPDRVKSKYGSRNFIGSGKRGRTTEIECLGVRFRRVSALRRGRRGAKIVENDCPN